MKKYYFIITLGVIFLLLSCLNVSAKQNTISQSEMLKTYGNLNVEELHKRGNAMVDVNNQEMALNFYDLAINKCDPSMSHDEKRTCAYCLNNAGVIYYFTKNNYIQSYSYFLRSLEIANECNDEELKTDLYVNLGNVYFLLCDTVNSIKMFKKSFYYSRKTKNWKNFMTSYNMIMIFAFYKKSIKDFVDDIKVFNKTKLPKAYIKKTKEFPYDGILSYINGDYDTSIRCFKATIRNSHILKLTQRNLVCDMILMGVVYIAKRDYAKALNTADECKRIILNDGTMHDLLIDVNNIYSDCYSAMGMKEKAKDYKLANYQINDSLFNVNRFTIVQNIVNMNKIAAKDMQMQQDRYKQKILFHTIIMLMIILIIVTVMIYLLYKKNKKLNEANQVLYRRCNETLNIPNNNNKEQKEEDKSKKYKSNALDDDVKMDLYKKIDNVLATNKDVLSPDFTIEKLAELVDSNVNYVSQIVNVYYRKNFSTIIGEIRVHEACRRIADLEHYGNLTIEAIALDIGFKTRQNFNIMFKKVTGLSPSKYKEMSQKRPSA